MSSKTPMPKPVWLTAQEAARVLDCHPATARKWAARGDLTVRRLTGERGLRIKGRLNAHNEPEVFVSQRLLWKLLTRS